MPKINLNTVIRIFEFSWLTSLSNFYKQCTLRCLYVHTGTYSPASHSLVLYNRKWVVRWNAAVFSSPHYTERERETDRQRAREKGGRAIGQKLIYTLSHTLPFSYTNLRQQCRFVYRTICRSYSEVSGLGTCLLGLLWTNKKGYFRRRGSSYQVAVSL